MIKKQATRANRAQVEQHIKRQRTGISGMEFAHRHPVLDAIAGAALLVVTIGGMVAMWIKWGAGV